MDARAIKRLLEDVAAGRTAPGEALATLEHFPMSEVAEAQATVDTHRALRTGVPEVIFGEGKSAEQIVLIARRLAEAGQTVLVTRVDPAKAEAVAEGLGEGAYDPLSRTFLVRRRRIRPKGRTVVVIGAGTSDAPVVEEAAIAAEVAGASVERIHDVGVAGLHRVAHHHTRLARAGVLVVVAGMEGALPSVVAGLAGRPVIAVPTSVGYGASFGGVAALLGMLNSCAPNVAVVNIDNGFGAGRMAAALAREMR